MWKTVQGNCSSLVYKLPRWDPSGGMDIWPTKEDQYCKKSFLVTQMKQENLPTFSVNILWVRLKSSPIHPSPDCPTKHEYAL